MSKSLHSAFRFWRLAANAAAAAAAADSNVSHMGLFVPLIKLYTGNKRDSFLKKIIALIFNYLSGKIKCIHN